MHTPITVFPGFCLSLHVQSDFCPDNPQEGSLSDIPSPWPPAYRQSATQAQEVGLLDSCLLYTSVYTESRRAEPNPLTPVHSPGRGAGS